MRVTIKLEAGVQCVMAWLSRSQRSSSSAVFLWVFLKTVKARLRAPGKIAATISNLCILAAWMLAASSTAEVAAITADWDQSRVVEDRFKEIWNKSQGLVSTASIDTHPVEFTLGKNHYRIPRNYLESDPTTLKDGVSVLHDVPTFIVTFPGFKPLTEETKTCLTGPLAQIPDGCIRVKFNLLGDRAAISDESLYNNAKPYFHNSIPISAPYGFDLNFFRSEKDPAEMYSKMTRYHFLVLDCSPFYVRGRKNYGCTNWSRLPDGNGIHYLWYEFSLENVEDVDSGIRDLMSSFLVGKDNK